MERPSCSSFAFRMNALTVGPFVKRGPYFFPGFAQRVDAAVRAILRKLNGKIRCRFTAEYSILSSPMNGR